MELQAHCLSWKQQDNISCFCIFNALIGKAGTNNKASGRSIKIKLSSLKLIIREDNVDITCLGRTNLGRSVVGTLFYEIAILCLSLFFCQKFTIIIIRIDLSQTSMFSLKHSQSRQLDHPNELVLTPSQSFLGKP